MVLSRHRTAAPADPITPARSGRGALGLTGFAVLVVVATDLGLPLPGGFLGVDMLLVALGFGMARSLRRPGPDNHWLKHFWLGRITRIGAPVLLAVALAAFYESWHGELEEPKLRAILGAVTMTQNFFTIFGGADFMAIDHLWLVGLVVQFALLVPFLVSFGRRHLRADRRVAAILCLGAAVATCRLGLLITEAADHRSIAINSLTRADGLLVGLAIGIAPTVVLRRHVPAQWAAPAFTGLLLLLLIAPDVDEFPKLSLGLLSGIVVLLTAVVVAAEATGGHGGALSATLANQPMRWLGARAMSMYIWHHLFGVALMVGVLDPAAGPAAWPGSVVFTARIIFSLAAAATSYRYLELPMRWRPSTSPIAARRTIATR